MLKTLFFVSLVFIVSCSATIPAYDYESIFKPNSVEHIHKDLVVLKEEILTNQQSKIDSIKSIQKAIRNPVAIPNYNLDEISNEFDANEYFNILTHLTLAKGYRLGFVWNGLPHLYSYQNNRIKDYKMYEEVLKNNNITINDKPYLNHIEVDDTAEGYFEFAILATLGEQFLLFGHANYNDVIVVCDSAKIVEIRENISERNLAPLEISNEKVLCDKLEPMTRIFEGIVSVEFLTFSKWTGFVKKTYFIERYFPHKILNIESEIVQKYNCGTKL